MTNAQTKAKPTPLVLFALAVSALGTFGASGCASEQKTVRTPFYSLSHPDYWKVESVATKDGEPTKVMIGRYSTTVMNEGVGADESSPYEASQADVEVRIYTWPEPGNAAPSLEVANKLANDGSLQITQHGRIPHDANECGQEFQRKYNLLGKDEEPLDLVKQPGFRTIVLGGKREARLVGVVARVPYEQDTGLYCHNLRNMQLQLQLLLAGMKPEAGPPPAAAPVAPAPPEPAPPPAPSPAPESPPAGQPSATPTPPAPTP